MRNLVQGGKALVLLGVTLAATIVACGRELAAPEQSVMDTGSRPEALALVAQNRYVCSIVLWSGDTTHARQSLRFRKTLPTSAGAAPDSGSLARYGFMRFNRTSGALQVDVVCVLPQSDQARQDAAAYFRKYDPLASNETLNAARSAGLRFSWEDGGDVWCSTDGYNLYCEGGVTCAMMSRAPAGTPSYSRRAATQGRSNDMMAVCDNGCDVYDFVWSCEGGGGGTIDYDGGGGGGSSGSAVTLDCSTYSVQRGDNVNCSAGGAGTAADYTFSFTPLDGSLNPVNRGSDVVSESWGGTMVTSGTVTVSATVNGQAATASRTITVTARSWSNLKPTFDPGVAATNSLPEYPRDTADLGFTWEWDVGVDGIAQPVSGGPNDGMYYTTSMHTQLYRISVNYVALTNTSAFALHQSGSPPDCRASDMSPTYRSFVEAHEGTTFQPNSHTYRHKTTLSAYDIGSPIESMVTQYVPTETDVTYRLSTAMNAAHNHSDALDHPAPVGPCNFKLFP